jgi:LmbE family N-acetylglucosaminyl deacetylase
MVNLIIAAHPDDEVLGCGGFIANRAKTEECYVLILTAGATGRYEESMEEVLRNSSIEANRVLGTKELFFENLPNQQLDTLPIIKVTQLIEKYINKLKPTRLFTHHGGDINRDHQIVYEATMTATRAVPDQIVKEVYTYNTPSSTEWNFYKGEKIFIPSVFEDITTMIDKKLEAISLYKSELRAYPHPRSLQALKTYANYWGITVGLEYAEPFTLMRKVRI